MHSGVHGSGLIGLKRKASNKNMVLEDLVGFEVEVREGDRQEAFHAGNVCYHRTGRILKGPVYPANTCQGHQQHKASRYQIVHADPAIAQLAQGILHRAAMFGLTEKYV